MIGQIVLIPFRVFNGILHRDRTALGAADNADGFEIKSIEEIFKPGNEEVPVIRGNRLV